VASNSGGPLVAAASPSFVGCSTITELPDQVRPRETDRDIQRAWQALRASPLAAWIGLTLPRVLLRLPYGKSTDPLEEFDFEELRQPAAHNQYLWGSSAVACAILIARAFQQSGWSFQPGEELELENIPAHVYEAQGEMTMKPCAEVFLPERVVYELLEDGLMPMICQPNRDTVRLVRFQSVAEPLQPLAGPWASG
jgi:type VI secretion system protein ImpC